jgi:hypothetical protein
MAAPAAVHRKPQVTPTVEGEEIICPCGETMAPVVGRLLDTFRWWLWWECEQGHITASIPLPDTQRLRALEHFV